MSKRRGLWEIAILALLREAPMHPYQMLRLLRGRHKDDLLVLKRGSLHHAIARLLDSRAIRAASSGRTGRRPEHTTYKITTEGRQELVLALRHLVSAGRSESPDFLASMSFLVYLTPKEATARLEERLQRLEKEFQSLVVSMKSASVRVQRINLIECEYLLAMRKAELRWVRDLLNELRSGNFSWNLEKIFKDIRSATRAAAKSKEK